MIKIRKYRTALTLPAFLIALGLSSMLVLPAAWAQTESNTTAPAVEAPETIELRTLVEKTNNYPIDLQTVLKLAEDQNLPLAENKVDVKINRSLVRQSEAALLPSIEGTYNQSRFKGGTQVFGGETFNVVRTTVQPQIAAVWTLYPGGSQIYQILAAKRRREASEFQVKETYQQQLSNAAQEYYGLLSANLQREIALKGIAEAQAQIDLNEALLKTGRGLKLDVMRSRATYAEQKRLLTEAETAIVQAEQLLLNRLNLDSNIHLIPKPEEGKQKALVPSSTPTAKLIDASLVDNPSIQRSEKELKALGVDYKVIRSDFIPSVTFRTYINKTGPDWGNLVRSDFSGISVSANLLENMGLQIPLRLQEKKGEIERAVLQQKELVRSIEAQVTSTFLSSRNDEAAIQASQEEFTAAEEAYNLALGRFRAGYGTNLDVIDAQAALTTARINVARAILSYNQAQVQLLEAMGKATPNTLVNGVTLNATTTP